MQIVGFIVVASILGISAQSVVPNGISPITALTLIETDTGSVAIPSVSINPGQSDQGSRAIKLADAYAAFQAGTALFLDARTPTDFALGHISGATNLPVEAFVDSLSYLDTLPLDQLLITYCDGEDCNASIDLGADLAVMGFTQVYFFFGGWQEWSQAGYPISVSSNE